MTHSTINDTHHNDTQHKYILLPMLAKQSPHPTIVKTETLGKVSR